MKCLLRFMVSKILASWRIWLWGIKNASLSWKDYNLNRTRKLYSPSIIQFRCKRSDAKSNSRFECKYTWITRHYFWSPNIHFNQQSSITGRKNTHTYAHSQICNIHIIHVRHVDSSQRLSRVPLVFENMFSVFIVLRNILLPFCTTKNNNMLNTHLIQYLFKRATLKPFQQHITSRVNDVHGTASTRHRKSPV